MSARVAQARAQRVWSDWPQVKNAALVFGLVSTLGAFVAVWKPIPGQVSRNTAEIGTLKSEVRQLRKESAFGSCRWQDSTTSQCIHHLRGEP